MPYNSFPGQRTIYRVERLKAGDKNQKQELEITTLGQSYSGTKLKAGDKNQRQELEIEL